MEAMADSDNQTPSLVNATPDWTTLAARFIDDLSRMIQAEIKLTELSLKSIMQSQLDQMLAMLTVVGLLLCAALCMIAAVILLLHHWMEWWEALALTALLSSVAAMLIRTMSSGRSVQQ
jgi:hypothetical protein